MCTCKHVHDTVVCRHDNYYYYYYRFMALWILYGNTQVSWYQKSKTSLDLLAQEIVSGSGICWAICNA